MAILNSFPHNLQEIPRANTRTRRKGRRRPSLFKLIVAKRLVAKTISLVPAVPSLLMPKYCPRARSDRGKIKTFQLLSRQVKHAILIYNTLLGFRCLEDQVPRLTLVNHFSNRIELEYPKRQFWKLSTDFFPPLQDGITVRDLRALRKALLLSISLLHNAHIPYVPKLSTLQVTRKALTGAFIPFLDTFDYNMDINDPKVSWAKLQIEALEKVKRSLDRLKFIVDITCRPKAETPHAELDPNIFATALKEFDPPVERYRFVITYVHTYSLDLGEIIIHKTLQFLCGLVHRSFRPLDAEQTQLQDQKAVVRHVLSLAEQHLDRFHGSDIVNLSNDNNNDNNNDHASVRVFADCAALVVLHAALLIQLYAKSVDTDFSKEIVILDDSDSTAVETTDMYRDDDHLRLVADARRKAALALQELDDADGILDYRIPYLIRRRGGEDLPGFRKLRWCDSRGWV
ncbi:hypothetical protein F4777DRAFT_47575 [Nemania sp. FL0916]|nr:hypothetical protein F4777DRAFT_47575 [Nemania sp. FL0916]